MITNYNLKDSLKDVSTSITNSHQQIKKYIDYKDIQLSTNIASDIKSDSSFINSMQTTIYKTAIANLEFEIEENVINVQIVQNDVNIDITKNLPSVEATDDN